MRVLGFFQKNHTAIQGWADTISKVAQVLALVLAGIWTYKTFYESEKPGLERRLSTSIARTWAAIPNDRDRCEVTLDVDVENTGKQAVDVTSVTIAGWISDRLPQKSGTPQFFDSRDVEAGQKFFDKSVDSPILVGHFPPGSTRTDAFVWYFKNEPGKVALWKVKLTTSKPTQFGTSGYLWDYVCSGLQQR